MFNNQSVNQSLGVDGVIPVAVPYFLGVDAGRREFEGESCSSFAIWSFPSSVRASKRFSILASMSSMYLGPRDLPVGFGGGRGGRRQGASMIVTA